MSAAVATPLDSNLAPKFQDLLLEPADNERLARLCGQLDEHLRQIERRLGVEINNRGHQFRVIGEPQAIAVAVAVLEALYRATQEERLTPAQVHLLLQEAGADALLEGESASTDEVVIRTRRGLIRGRGPNQQRYLWNIQHHDLNFGVGPAGTGKTYLAVACAVDALEGNATRRLVLVRPAVEAGERLGFLPGDMTQKIDPYLRPLYDALYEMLGFERVAKLIERNIIEVAPLAFMRGRTLNDSFIILDEAQNTTVEQMKMFLTRIGFGSTAVVTGDITQVDLPRNVQSGLRHVLQVLKDVEGISMTLFNARDVVRHPLVQRIVSAYARFEQDNPS
ncbi:MAG TPA: PhoH family protein [Candidatus Competibacter sp.]|nr:phosphate starvation-inducible protein PhoH [Candidatus Competibacteraceae bacterium]HRE53505.1 PhoH family protein [Candidatus Competibacter sp.]HUM93440.1 PhoH family protein [Candidatus Competibacter sp.]